ncbi:single-stranded DNA-binding protein [Amycolatopsis acidicola]|uniref:Single-stranded DNA-binding protein n=1 Tax=Amycolatopsis acidicola TaxID=2596893 RepID=A0A5N0V163_9PSEU|nr:single-stranded DNA-binding protein [Amycolatopsis acidicola]KAA9157969.1 single-stranded DNA-binding protein [Amycolatopsis acidicola]
MAGDTIITIIGNLTADPASHFFPSGAFVANFTVASTPRTFDRASGDWKDGEALFLRCNAWGKLGEHVVDSVSRGARVIVQGRLKQRTFETTEGEKRTVVELDVDEFGPSLKYATATVTKAAKAQRPQPAQTDAPGGGEVADDDPWGAPEPELVGAGAGSGEKPPF